MVRQTLKRSTTNSQQNQDLIFLLSNIRSRENALVFFLELFTLANNNKLTSEHYAIYKHQFLQKQKLSTQQIKLTIEKVASTPLPQNQVRSFWIKLKSIIKVSQERARSLGLLNQNIQHRYEEIIRLIDKQYESNSPITQYLLIQQLVKKRTIETLVTTKQLYTDHPSQQFGKIRSETFLKGQLKPTESINYSPAHRNPEPLSSIQQVLRVKDSSNRLRKREKIKGKSAFVSKKIQASLCRYQRNLADIMDLRIDYLIDKKKTLVENQMAIYDILFAKNISNHKIISKYSHSCSKFSQKIIQLRRAHNQQNQKRNLSQSRVNKKAPQNPQEMIDTTKHIESKQKILRPKTSKQSKRATLIKSSNVRTEKIYQLLKMI